MFGWTLQVEPAVVQYIATFGKSAEYGARPMERLVEGTLGIGIAEFQLLHGAISEDATIGIKKLSATHGFRTQVGNKYVDYTVDPADNGIMSSAFAGTKFFKFLESIRLYGAHD